MQGCGPDSDSGEEVALPVDFEVGGSNIANIPFVDHAGRQGAARDQIAQPLRGV
jgi:hypothetical protein